MLIGIAIAEGRIRSVDDVAAVYVPALANAKYGRTPLRHLLQMTSGVLFIEEYTGTDDVSTLAMITFMQWGAGGVAAVTPFNQRVRPSGTGFSYQSVETQVLGLVLRHAVGRPVAEYLEEKIWQPIGAEADATWLVDTSGQEATHCCINAGLRDYARLGLLLATGGDDRSFPRRGSRTRRPCVRISRTSARGWRRRSSATAIRRGSSRVSGGCSRCLVCGARRSTSIRRAVS
jgi:CubicO group peptidase (beta-lactamase class C family)